MIDRDRIMRGLYWDRAWSLISGCTPRSVSCLGCWSASEAHMRGARRDNAKIQERYGGLTDDKGGWTGEVRLMKRDLQKPLSTRAGKVWAVWTDLFFGDEHDREVCRRRQAPFNPVPFEFVASTFDVMQKTDSRHRFLILTKRPERARDFLRQRQPLTNLWVGTTAENQECADRRGPALKVIAQMGWRTFVSYEPALGLVDWTGWNFLEGMVAGGQSGRGKDVVPLPPFWVRCARDWCQSHNVHFFFKQWGEWLPASQARRDFTDKTHRHYCGRDFYHVGKRTAGRELDGRLWNALPWQQDLVSTEETN